MIDELNTEIIKELESVENNIINLNKKDYSQRPKLIRRCEDQIASIATKIQSYDLEILYLDKVKAGPYNENFKKIQERTKKVTEDLDFKKKEREAEGTLLGEIMKKRGPEDQGSALIQIGDALQQKGNEALQRIMAKVEASNQIADEITLELYRQIEKLESTTNTLKETRDDIKKANVYIKYFARELYKDKIIMVLVVLCIIAIAVILIVKLKNGLGSSTTTTNTTTSTDGTVVDNLIYY